jgi:hypothetical protein
MRCNKCNAAEAEEPSVFCFKCAYNDFARAETGDKDGAGIEGGLNERNTKTGWKRARCPCKQRSWRV